MAIVTTTTTGVPVIDVWDIPDQTNHHQSFIPRGEVVFRGSQTIPTLGAGDENHWLLDMTLPDAFVFRLVESTMHVEADISDLADPADGMQFTLTDVKGTRIWTMANDFITGTAAGYITPGDIAGSNDTATEFTAIAPPESFMGTSGVIQGVWLNLVPTTGIMIPTFFFRFLMYDVEQLRHWQVHAPAPTIYA